MGTEAWLEAKGFEKPPPIMVWEEWLWDSFAAGRT
jgi:hypothetical protein